CYRLALAEIMHLDFKSQYVSASDRMGLQRFWLAKRVTVRDCTEELRAWLAAQTPEGLVAPLGRPHPWPPLPVPVPFHPHVLLTRLRPADFARQREHAQRLHAGTRGIRPRTAGTGASSAYNIGQVYLRSKTPLWYTLAEVLAGIIRDGMLPPLTQMQALAFLPSAEQVETRPVTLAGQLIDPSREGLWTHCIDLRREVKRAADDARACGDLTLATHLDGQQHALKETALAGSYGIAEELNEQVYEGQALTLDVYALGHTHRHGNVVETPGPY